MGFIDSSISASAPANDRILISKVSLQNIVEERVKQLLDQHIASLSSSYNTLARASDFTATKNKDNSKRRNYGKHEREPVAMRSKEIPGEYVYDDHDNVQQEDEICVKIDSSNDDDDDDDDDGDDDDDDEDDDPPPTKKQKSTKHSVKRKKKKYSEKARKFASPVL